MIQSRETPDWIISFHPACRQAGLRDLKHRFSKVL